MSPGLHGFLFGVYPYICLTVFLGACAPRGRASPTQPQPIHIVPHVRKARPTQGVQA